MPEKIKAGELKQGDVIIADKWSSLWLRIVPTTCTVMDVTVFGSNVNIMAKAMDGMKEYITEIFAARDTEFAAA